MQSVHCPAFQAGLEHLIQLELTSVRLGIDRLEIAVQGLWPSVTRFPRSGRTDQC